MALAFRCAGMVLLLMVYSSVSIYYLNLSPHTHTHVQTTPSTAPPHATIQDRQQVCTYVMLKQWHISPLLIMHQLTHSLSSKKYSVAIDAPPGLTQETLGPLLTDLENQIAGDEISGLPSDSPPLTVGVAGGSGSGKTTFARALYEALGEENVTYLTHDSYYKDLSHLPLAERAKTNFDHPNALDTALLVEHVQRLKRGETVQVPEYDFATHCRHPTRTVAAVPQRVILVEGILIFSDPALVKELSIKVFIDTESDLRLIRRIHRDVKERGRSLESIVDQYVKTVRPMHMEFVETSKREADVIIPLGMNQVRTAFINASCKLPVIQTNEILSKIYEWNQVALDMFLSRLQQEIGDGTLLRGSGASTGGDAVSALPSSGSKKKKESSFIRLGKQGSLSMGKMSS